MRKGQVIAQLVDDDYRAAVAQAQAASRPRWRNRRPEGATRLQLANVEAARALVASTSASVNRMAATGETAPPSRNRIVFDRGERKTRNHPRAA